MVFAGGSAMRIRLRIDGVRRVRGLGLRRLPGRELAQLGISRRLARSARAPPPDAGKQQQTQSEQYPAKLRSQFSTPYIAAMRTASSTSTATRRDTPGSFMVTPTNCDASSMVVLL